jgi:hypothetical protein
MEISGNLPSKVLPHFIPQRSGMTELAAKWLEEVW